MSTPPRRSTTKATIRSTCSLTVTFVSETRACPPSASISWTTRWPAGRSMSAMTTTAPARARPRAMARPIPLPPPVTMALLPSSCIALPLRTSSCLGLVQGHQQGPGLVQALLVLPLGDAVVDDAGPGLDMGHAILEDDGADGDGGVHVAGEADVAHRPGVGATALRLQLGDDLHGPHLGGAADGPRREAGPQGVGGAQALLKLPCHVRDQVHHVGVALHLHELRDADGAGLADAADVVAAQVQEHDVLRPLLLIGPQLLVQSPVLLRGGR